jgi:hypothetical protein
VNLPDNPITLALRTLRRTYVPIGDWPAFQNAVTQGDIDIHFMICSVALRDPDGNEMVVEDRLEPFIHELCIEAPRRLMRGEDYTFRNWDFNGAIALHHDGERIRIDADASAISVRISVRFGMQTLIAALLERAEQTIDFMQRLVTLDASYPYALHRYTEELVAARRSYDAAYGTSGD